MKWGLRHLGTFFTPSSPIPFYVGIGGISVRGAPSALFSRGLGNIFELVSIRLRSHLK